LREWDPQKNSMIWPPEPDVISQVSATSCAKQQWRDDEASSASWPAVIKFHNRRFLMAPLDWIRH
jgi:hypothetical protein